MNGLLLTVAGARPLPLPISDLPHSDTLHVTGAHVTMSNGMWEHVDDHYEPRQCRGLWLVFAEREPIPIIQIRQTDTNAIEDTRSILLELETPTGERYTTHLSNVRAMTHEERNTIPRSYPNPQARG